MKVGIRKETQYPSEKRAALTPEHVRELVKQGIEVFVEPADGQRIFKSEEYINAGAIISESLENVNIIFGVKEVPINDLIPNKPFVFFSHTIKGQSYNMPLLQAILDKKITLMDYELVKNDDGFRIIFFGKFAGYAGIIDSLWLMGQKLLTEGIDNPFSILEQAPNYNMLSDARKELELVAKKISTEGLPDQIAPFITGFTGYGNVSKGAQELYDILPTIEIKAEELESFIKKGEFSNKIVYKVEFKEQHMYKNKFNNEFDFNHFLEYPNEYESIFYKYLPHLSMLVNGIYWEERFPKHVTKKLVNDLYSNPKPKLKVIGDITCDIEGSIEMTVKATSSNNPAYVYEPKTNKIIDGIKGNGPVILAVDKLPAELPKEASKMFGDALFPFVKDLASADYSADFDKLDLPKEFKNAIIAHKGKLTPNYEYLSKFLR